MAPIRKGNALRMVDDAGIRPWPVAMYVLDFSFFGELERG